MVSTDADCADAGEALAAVQTGDCADTDAARNPGLTETAGDGVDSDCDLRELCWTDLDDDGQTAAPAAPVSSADLSCAAAGLTAVNSPVDCDDDDGLAFVGATEVEASGIDEDCDGLEACWVDADLDGWRTEETELSPDLSCRLDGLAVTSTPSGDCDDAAAAVNPGAVEDPTNGIDDDCTDGVTCPRDDDRDGAASGTVLSADDDCADPGEAPPGSPADCDDDDATRYPAATEVVGNGADEDCDGGELCRVDNDDDGFLAAGAAVAPSSDADCADPREALSAAPTGDCDDASAAAYPGASEVTADSVDQDCSGGDLCWVDGDDDGWLVAAAGTAASSDLDCADAGEGSAAERALAADCDDAAAAVHPDAAEQTGVEGDLDCDGRVSCWVDADRDGERSEVAAPSSDEDCGDAGEALATAIVDCDDALAAVNHRATELPGDLRDQDCDGAELCFIDGDGDGFGVSATVSSADLGCDGAGEAAADGEDCDDDAAAVFPGATELPGDALDQDCDGEELCFADGDNDGWRTEAQVGTADVSCAGAGLALAATQAGDCDDAVARTYPGAAEGAADGVDSDCDGEELCPVDGDGDGQPVAGAPVSGDLACAGEGLTATLTPVDCDDADAGIYTGAAEGAGDGVDSDCDGQELCLVDADGDGFAGLETALSADLSCSSTGLRPAGGLTDCDDGAAQIYPGAFDIPGNGVAEDCEDGVVCQVDADGDGFGTAETVESADGDCEDPGEAYPNEPDCDDSSALAYPGGAELTGDGLDGDCDGFESCFVDADRDGWRTDLVVVSPDTDCLDLGEAPLSLPAGDCADADAAIHPEAEEQYADGVDSDCNGTELCWVDGDGDGQTSSPALLVDVAALDCAGHASAATPVDCDDADAAIFVGADETPGDGVDSDCDGSEGCYVDADGDGWGTRTVVAGPVACDGPGQAAPGAPLDDCDDADGAVHPGAMEASGDATDSDCDGLEVCFADGDGDAQPAASLTIILSRNLQCAEQGITAASAPLDCDDGDAGVFVGAIEQAGDGVDQDCDARELCYVDGDQDGFRVANTVTTADLSCAAAGLALAAAPGPDCNDGDASIYPGAPDDPADGIDQDCDEAISCLADLDLDSYADPLAFVLAADGDCTDLGELPLGSPVDCDDSDPLVNPGAAETPADFIDSDCDGQELCFVDFDGDGWAIDDTVGSFDLACDELGEAPAGAPQGDCDDGDAGVSPAAVEGIADGVDADCNGVELCYVDGDGDGWRVGEEVLASFELSCQGDGYADATAPEGDCDDDDVSRNPDAEEVVGDEVDQDCDGGEACYVDDDGDGWRVEEVLDSVDADCADAGEAAAALPVLDCADDDPSRFPAAGETVGDGVDQDCDGSDLTSTCFADRDGDGFRTNEAVVSTDADCADPGEAPGTQPGDDCDDAVAAVFPGATEVVDDGVDQDCDWQESCWADGDADGWRGDDLVLSADLDCFDLGEAPSLVPEGDCDDADADVNPDAPELVADGIDQDCDGSESCYVDADSDGLRPDETSTVLSDDADCDDAGEATDAKPPLDCDDSSGDADEDGLDDAREVLQLNTDACNPDTDDDGAADGREINDMATDPLDPDTDGGGVYDGREDAEGTNPLDPDDDVVLVDDDKPEGCGCATTDRSAAWVLLLAVVGLRRRRG